MRSKNHALMGLVFLFAGMAAGCADDPSTSDEYAALEEALAQTQTQLATVEADRDQLQATVDNMGGQTLPFDQGALAAAWGSGDADQIRAFYTDDAVMLPFGHIISTLDRHPMPEYWDISGPDMDREAFEHEGANFEILSNSQIGNMVVTTGRWTFPEELYPDLADTVIQTADVMHLRDGKIWRHIGSFEVYVGGNLMDL